MKKYDSIIYHSHSRICLHLLCPCETWKILKKMTMSPQTKKKCIEWLTLLFWTFFVIAFIYLIIIVKGAALIASH